LQGIDVDFQVVLKKAPEVLKKSAGQIGIIFFVKPLIVRAFAVVFWKKMEVLKLRPVFSVESIWGKRTLVSAAAKPGNVRIKARSLCDLCHSRPVSGNLYRVRIAVTIGAYDYL